MKIQARWNDGGTRVLRNIDHLTEHKILGLQLITTNDKTFNLMVVHYPLFDIYCQYYYECELHKKYTIEDLSKTKMEQTGFRMKCCSTGAVIHVKDGKMIDREW